MQKAACAAVAVLLAVDSAVALVDTSPPESLLFVGINSAVSHAPRRHAARVSWMQHQLVEDGQVVARFIVSDNITDSAPDHRHSHDMVSLSVPEGYHHLTAKTMALLRWFNENASAKYLLKLDDDSYPHLDKLLPILNDTVGEFVYMGRLYEHAPVMRTGKNAESLDAFEQETYPKYMAGGGYILSAPLVREILAANPISLSNENTTVGLAVDAVNRKPGKQVVYRPLSLSAGHWECSMHDVLTLNDDYRKFECYWEGENRGRLFNKCIMKDIPIVEARGCASRDY